MKIKSVLTGKIFEAAWAIEKTAFSSSGQPVLILKDTGEAADPAFYEILEELELREGRG